MSKHLVSACLLGASLFAAAAARAVDLEGHDPPRPTYGRVELDVLVDGSPLRTVPYGGRAYLVVPRLGVEHQVRVVNRTPRRVAALVAVDGLSVINGQPTSDGAPGYLVDAGGQIVIKGWRRNLETVAAFRFVPRAGHTEGVGTIGVVAFEERVLWRPLPMERMAPFAPGRHRDGALGSTGTDYGRDIDAGAYYVPFTRSAIRHSVLYHYDTADALRRAGVPVDSPPFPRSAELPSPPPR